MTVTDSNRKSIKNAKKIATNQHPLLASMNVIGAINRGAQGVALSQNNLELK
jgi:hypothetical protein